MTHEHTHEKIGWTIILNIIITVSEYIGGTLSGSLALLSDAGHNLSDVTALILSFFGEKISDKKATKKHTFGFKRTEVFTALINALVLWGISTYIIVEAINRFGVVQPISLGIMIGVGSIGLFGNIFSVMILNKEKGKNLNMKAAYLHLFYDAISAVGVIVTGIIIYYTHFYVLDIIMSIIISLMIFWGGLNVIKSSLHIFMQGVPEGIDFNKVEDKIKKIKNVKTVHDLHLWAIDSNEIRLSCHVCVEKVKNSDDIINSINKMLLKEFNIEHTTIQLENTDICKAEAV